MGERGRVPALDGVRGVAILLVLACHARVPGVGEGAGAAGVGVFFVLSGYLITGRLMSGQSLRTFYLRRAARLVPALLLMVVVTGAYWLRLGVDPWIAVRAVTYTTNLATPFGELNGFGYGHTWTLALEEQFYVAWPLIFLWARPTVPRLVAVALTAMSAQVATWWALGWVFAYSFPLTSFGPLALGCALALSGVRLRTASVGLAALTVAAVMPGGVGAVAIPGVLAGTAAGVVLIASPASLPLGQPWLRWFGDRSYGIYLWHFPLLYFAPWNAAGRALVVVVAVLVAAASWRFVERPAIRWASVLGQERWQHAQVDLRREERGDRPAGLHLDA